MSVVVLEEIVDGRVVEALAEAGVTKLDEDTLEVKDETDSDIEHVRIYTE